jgi:hypothetical protein
MWKCDAHIDEEPTGGTIDELHGNVRMFRADWGAGKSLACEFLLTATKRKQPIAIREVLSSINDADDHFSAAIISAIANVSTRCTPRAPSSRAVFASSIS